MSRKVLILLLTAALFGACSGPGDETPAAAVQRLSNEFVAGYYAQFPEEVYEVGYPDGPTDRFGDHGPEAMARWDAKIDAWLAALDAIDAESLSDDAAILTWVFTRERLQAIVDRRVCRTELWNVSPTWTGWQSSVIATLAVQDVATKAARNAAIDRLADIDRYLDTEIGNLKRGKDAGYLAPATNVSRVIDQVTALIDTPADESPFLDPVARSDDERFARVYRRVYDEEVRPALVEYRDFLANEYPGRDTIGVGANPDGEACYAASVRYWSSLPGSADEIHRTGLSEMSRIRAEMLGIAEAVFDTDDLDALAARLRTDPAFLFASEQDMLDYVSAAVDRAKAAIGDWVGFVPNATLVIVPSPAYEQDSGGGFYAAGSPDGTQPGRYQVGTWNATSISRGAGIEATAFHESYPGHHLQVSIALQNDELPPILRYMYSSGMAEGWGLYSERLADEMGLYSGDLDRIGMLSNEAYRAARLVVDPGMHVMGWTRQQAIDYMLEHTTENAASVASEVDRYAAVPGQATSYLVGSLEIQRLRRHAETLLGERFDIRDFHDRVLANGGVTLPMLETAIEAWIEEVLAAPEPPQRSAMRALTTLTGQAPPL